ncbi:actin nucleation-promoting factor WASL-like [Marmota monax]|uniref:actin nucleation-promoting factor WASL-like n=1 Tax=Marmota monax TaxID=9995 RepID=UPI0026EE479E|nr:actin nucleation-promoting factor WASL-like [Marmota monax]
MALLRVLSSGLQPPDPAGGSDSSPLPPGPAPHSSLSPAPPATTSTTATPCTHGVFPPPPGALLTLRASSSHQETGGGFLPSRAANDQDRWYPPQAPPQVRARVGPGSLGHGFCAVSAPGGTGPGPVRTIARHLTRNNLLASCVSSLQNGLESTLSHLLCDSAESLDYGCAHTTKHLETWTSELCIGQ